MDDTDVKKIEKIINDRQEANTFYSNNSPVYRAFLKMEEAAFTDGTLQKDTKSLLRLAYL